jgi:hypothetical protein
MNMVADSLESLPEYDDAQGKTFSTAEWYTERKRWVFLTSSADYREKLLPLHSVWLDLFHFAHDGPLRTLRRKASVVRTRRAGFIE